VYRGEHEPILSRDLFEAVQEKLSTNAVDRQIRLRGSAALLAGRLYDDRGNLMSPTHANKKGVRYRYYVSHALLQNRKAEAGSIARVPAPKVESLVCDGVRPHLAAMGKDRELIERHIARVVVKPQTLEVCLNPRRKHRFKVKIPASLIHFPASIRRTRSRCLGRHRASQP
jgi:site-specific DNA recombinase